MVVRISVLLGLVLSCALAPLGPVDASDTGSIKLGFSAGDLGDTWRVIEFPDRKPTEYTYRADSEAICARAESSAAGLARDFPGGSGDWTTLAWEWRIGKRVEKGNARQKSGDDYAGRVYVNYRNSEGLSYWERFKLSTFETFYGREVPRRSINYVWANRLQPGEIVPSPYTDRVKLVSLRDWKDPVGEWVTERINLKATFEEIYDSEYAAPDSLAIMTDTDNTGDTVTTCYRNLRLIR